MILSIDFGNKLGWAYGQEKIIDHGMIKLPVPWGHDAAVRLQDIFRNFRIKFGVRKVFCERVGGRFYNSNKALMAMTGILQTVYDDKEVVYISPGTIKKYWFGKGNATKLDMVKITQMNYPDVVDDNESDAIAIWHYGTRKTYNIMGFK